MDDLRAQWAAAWVAAWSEMPEIEQTSKAVIPGRDGKQGFEYRYTPLADVLAKVRPVLTKHGLAVNQRVETLATGTVSVTTVLTHQAGHSEPLGALSMPAGGDARSIGSTITYARRYSLLAALGIAPDDDADAVPAKAASKPRASKPKPTPADVPSPGLHDKAWLATLDLAAAADADLPRATAVFTAALAAAKVRSRISTDAEYEAVFAHVEQELDAETYSGG